MMDVDLPCHQTVSVIYGAWFGHDVTLTSLEQEYIFSKTYKGLQHVYKKGWIVVNTSTSTSEAISQPSTTLHPYNYP